jgi:hypothetical protein
MDSESIRQCAAHCRLLAEKADPFIKRRLLELAMSYDAKFDLSLRAPARTFGIPGSLLEALLPSQRDTGPTEGLVHFWSANRSSVSIVLA